MLVIIIIIIIMIIILVIIIKKKNYLYTLNKEIIYFSAYLFLDEPVSSLFKKKF